MTTTLAPESPAEMAPDALHDAIADVTARRTALTADHTAARGAIAAARVALVDGTGRAAAVTAAQNEAAALVEALAEVAARLAPLTAEAERSAVQAAFAERRGRLRTLADEVQALWDAEVASRAAAADAVRAHVAERITLERRRLDTQHRYWLEMKAGPGGPLDWRDVRNAGLDTPAVHVYTEYMEQPGFTPRFPISGWSIPTRPDEGDAGRALDALTLEERKARAHRGDGYQPPEE